MVILYFSERTRITTARLLAAIVRNVIHTWPVWLMKEENAIVNSLQSAMKILFSNPKQDILLKEEIWNCGLKSSMMKIRTGNVLHGNFNVGKFTI